MDSEGRTYFQDDEEDQAQRFLGLYRVGPRTRGVLIRAVRISSLTGPRPSPQDNRSSDTPSP